MNKCLFKPEQIKIYDFLAKPQIFLDKVSKNEIFTLNELVKEIKKGKTIDLLMISKSKQIMRH